MSNALFDITTLNTAKAANEGVTITLRHPETNAKLPLKVTILGADSDKYRRVSDASLNAVFKEIAKTGKTVRTAEDVREEKINAVCDCITGWESYADGETPLDCTPENKLAVLSNPGYGWMLDQIDAGIRDRANFLPS